MGLIAKLDALVDRKNRHVAGAGQPPRVEDLRVVAQDTRRTVGLGEHPVDVVGTRQVERVLGKTLGLVGEQGLGVIAKVRVDLGSRDGRGHEWS
jgi:hypothetical protein